MNAGHESSPDDWHRARYLMETPAAYASTPPAHHGTNVATDRSGRAYVRQAPRHSGPRPEVAR